MSNDIEAFPLMRETVDGTPNEHPELTAMKSV